MVEYETVNFMLWWNEFRWFMNVRNDSSPWVHIRNISSMNLFHVRGVRLLGVDDRSDFSNEPMKILAYDGAIFVPIAVPCFWRYSWFLKVK